MATLARPGRVARARAARRETASVAAGAVRPLLAPFWLPYRHGLDELAAIGSAVVGEAGARAGTPEGRASRGARVRRSPALWLLASLAVLSLVAGRQLLGGGRLSGGALLPAPDSAFAWWGAYLSTTHDVATGSAITAPAYLLPLAALATLLGGSASLAVDLLVLGAVPLAAVGAHRFLRRVSGSRVGSVWGAVSYALLLATCGAVAQGRLGTLVAAAVLPWLAASAMGLAARSADRRRRAAWRSALWLALGAAFAPLAWLLAALVTVVAAATVAATHGRRDLLRTALVPAAGGRGAAPALVSPGLAGPVLGRRSSSRRGFPPRPSCSRCGPSTCWGRTPADGAAAPVWIAWPVGLLAVLALLETPHPRPGGVRAGCWHSSASAAVWVLTGLRVDDPVLPGTVRVWAGLPLLLLHGAWVTAAVLGAAGLGLAGRAVVRLAAAAGSAGRRPSRRCCRSGGAVWWVAHGSDDPLHRADTTDVPAYMDSAAQRDPADGTLVLRGGHRRRRHAPRCAAARR